MTLKDNDKMNLYCTSNRKYDRINVFSSDHKMKGTDSDNSNGDSETSDVDIRCG